MSNFVALHTALSGIRAAQAGMDTASHNVANAHTPGHTRQRVDLQSRLPHLSPIGPLGTGVDVTAITRIRDSFLDARVRGIVAEYARYDTTHELLSRAEGVLGEPEGGLATQLGALWDALEDLGLDPDDAAARQAVVSQLSSLATQVRGVAHGWDELAADTAEHFGDTVTSVNDLLARVATLNRQIGDVMLRSGTPNDLLDQRDVALDELARVAGATFTTDADGQVGVAIGGQVLVDGPVASELEVADGGLRVTGGDEVAAGGKLGATRDFLTVTLPARQAELDTFVAGLADALNTQHAAGYDPDGAAGGPLLTFDPEAGAARSLAVDPAVLADPRRLAAAADPAAPAHDGRNADALAALRTAKADGASLDDQLRRLVVDIAAGVAGARNGAASQASLAAAAETARQSMHGVSIDEEMVALVQHQRALEASSRIMTAVDEALDVLINRTGIVGR